MRDPGRTAQKEISAKTIIYGGVNFIVRNTGGPVYVTGVGYRHLPVVEDIG